MQQIFFDYLLCPCGQGQGFKQSLVPVYGLMNMQSSRAGRQTRQIGTLVFLCHASSMGERKIEKTELDFPPRSLSRTEILKNYHENTNKITLMNLLIYT